MSLFTGAHVSEQTPWISKKRNKENTRNNKLLLAAILLPRHVRDKRKRNISYQTPNQVPDSFFRLFCLVTKENGKNWDHWVGTL